MKEITEKNVKGICKAIANAGAKLAAEIHAVGVYAVKQSYQGNPNPAVWLVEAMHKSQRVEAIKAWLVHFGALKWNKESGSMAHRTRKDIGPDKVEGMIAEAEKTPYWELTKEAAISNGEYDVLSHLLAIMKTADNIAAGKSSKFHTLKHPESLKALKKAIGNQAANDVSTESGDVSAIAEAMAKRPDATDLLLKLADQLGLELTLPEEMKKAA